MMRVLFIGLAKAKLLILRFFGARHRIGRDEGSQEKILGVGKRRE